MCPQGVSVLLGDEPQQGLNNQLVYLYPFL